MARSLKRQHQISDLIQHHLALLIRREVSDPRLKTMNITAVEMTPDLGLAKVFFTLFDEQHQKEAEKALLGASGYLRKLLADAVALRYTPKLLFLYDASIKRASDLSSLLDSL